MKAPLFLSAPVTSKIEEIEFIEVSGYEEGEVIGKSIVTNFVAFIYIFRNVYKKVYSAHNFCKYWYDFFSTLNTVTVGDE